MKLERHKHFKKDMTNVRLGDAQFDKFIRFISALSNGDVLPPESLDHALSGVWDGFREFHVGGDMVVVYRVDGDSVILSRIGTHSQIFG